MSKQFIVQDLVAHIDDEAYPSQAPHPFHRTVRNLWKKLWLFLIIGLAAGAAGFLGIYLPEIFAGSAAQNAQMSLPGGISPSDLSPEQIDQAKKMLQGQ